MRFKVRERGVKCATVPTVYVISRTCLRGAKVKWIERIVAAMFLLLLGGELAVASEEAKVAWHTNVVPAWQQTQQQGRPLLVFVTRENCFYCTQMKDRTWANAVVSGAISQSFVALVLDGGVSTPLLRDLNVTMYPATFVISPQAVVVARIDGYVAPEVLAERLNSLRPQLPIAKVVKDP